VPVWDIEGLQEKINEFIKELPEYEGIKRLD